MRVNAEEARQNRISSAGMFDKLVETNLALATAVGRLVRVSYAVLILQAVVMIFVLWRR